jgi:uncharacterized membrane protein
MDRSRLNMYVRFILVAGMALSVSVMAIGLVWYAISPGNYPDVILSPAEIPEEISRGNPIAMLDLGILFLIATPLARVIAGLAFYLMDKEMRMAGVSVIILAVIGIAVVLGAS